jgi:hypothetical protein
MAQDRGPANWNGLLLHDVPRKYSRLTMLAAEISRRVDLSLSKRVLLSGSQGMILNKHYEVGERTETKTKSFFWMESQPRLNIFPERLKRSLRHWRSRLLFCNAERND